ncbi:MAG: YceI family protein [Flammeovirgaceae bacterium]
MKKIFLLVIATCLGFVSSAQTVSHISLKESVLKWKGSQLFDFNNHYGTVKFKEGYLDMAGNAIKGGSFVVDMNTITNTDGKYNESLVDHLKNEDFFEVSKYPTSQLKITEINNDLGMSMTVKADLTIKGITNQVEFQAQKANKGEQLIITAKFIIDRSKWNVKYGSQSFFKNLGDETISDAIEFEVRLVIEKC